MTWRKIFLYLLLTSTLVLAAVSTFSLWYETQVTIRSLRCSVLKGTIATEVTEWRNQEPGISGLDTPGISFRQRPLEHAPVGYAWGGWKSYREESKLMDVTFRAGIRHEAAALRVKHILHIPLWAPWLLFVGCTYAFCKRMEKQSASGMEKELAEQRAQDHPV